MYNNKYTYSKKEKLCSRKDILRLFEHGNTFYSDPFRLLWLKSEDTLPFPALTGISVGKKSFSKAVDRNRIKRLIRETWRVNKQHLYGQLEQINIQIVIMIIYSGDKIPEFSNLNERMQEAIRKFLLHLNTTKENK